MTTKTHKKTRIPTTTRAAAIDQRLTDLAATLDNKSDTDAVINLVEALPMPPNAIAEQIGSWVWITFKSKPPADLRAVISEAGFRYNKRRSTWQHPCNTPSKSSAGNPRLKYNSATIRTRTAAEEE